MEGLSSVTSVPEELTAAVAACFGTQLVSEALSSELRQSLPFATFARVSIRCGSGLFVTDDLLQPGPILLTMVSLQSSMAGLAMREGKPVALAVSPGMGDKWQSAGDGPPTTSVVCYPVGVERHYDGLCQSYIGAVQLGLAELLSDRAHAELEELCRCLGPYLLLVSLTKVQDMSKLMSLPGTECVCCTGEEEEPEEDAPFGRCLDDLGPGGPPGGSSPPQTAANLAGPATASHQQQQQQQQEEQYEDEQQRQGRQQQQQALKEAQQQELQGIGVVRGSLEAPSTPLASSSQRTLPALEQQQPAKEEEEGPETGPAATAAAALAQAERLLIEQQWVEPGQAGAEEVPWAAMEAAVAAVPAADERRAAPAAAVAAEQAAGLAAAAAGALYESAAGQPTAAAVAADAARMAAAAAAGAYESPKKPSAGTEGLRYRSKGVLSEPGTSSGEFEASPFVTGKGGKGSLPHHKHQQQQKFAELEPCGSTSSEGYAEEEDPKAAAKRARSALSAATLRQGLLLTFRDPAVETRFRQEQAQDLCKMDLLFHLVYLVAFACTAAMDPPGVLGVATNIWLAWVLALPAVTIVTCTEWVARRYVRWRSWLLIPVTLLHMLHYRFAAAPALLQVLPTTALRKLPWLLRCTGAEALLVFPLGSKMPFSVFLPTQLASMLLMLTLLPGPCEALLPLLACNPGCLPAGWGVRSGAALLGAGFLLPTCAVYFGEHRARRHFASTVQAMQA